MGAQLKASSQLRRKSSRKVTSKRLGNIQLRNMSCYAADNSWAGLFKVEKKAESKKKKTINEVTFLCQENNPAEMVSGLISSNSRSTEGSYQEHHAKDGRSL